mgnify:CR=1 FL=1
MYEDYTDFLELIGNLHFQQILYKISIILLVVIALGTIYFHGTIISIETCQNFRDICSCICKCNLGH